MVRSSPARLRPAVLALVLVGWLAAIGARGSESGADLAVTLRAARGSLAAGTAQIYEISVTNHGPEVATAVELQHELPRGAQLLGVEPSALGCEPLRGLLVRCDLGDLERGASAQIVVGARIDSRAEGKLVSEVVVVGDHADPVGANDEDVVETTVVPARQAIAVSRDRDSLVVATLKEGETSVGLAFFEPRPDGERGHKVEAVGFRSAALTAMPSFGGSDAPEIASLAAGFDAGTKVVLLDAASRELIAEHDIGGEWQARGIVALESFAGGAAPELALLLDAAAAHRSSIVIIDAASGRSVREHQLAPSLVPTEMVAIPSVEAGSTAEVAILGRARDTGETLVLVLDVDRGIFREHRLGPGLLPLGIVKLGDLALEGGTSAVDLAALVLEAASFDVRALVLDAGNGELLRSVDFDDDLLAGAFAAVPGAVDGSTTALAAAGVRSAGPLEVEIRDPVTGDYLARVAIEAQDRVTVPLALVAYGGLVSGPGPGVGLLYEHPGEPTRFWIFDASSARSGLTLLLP